MPQHETLHFAVVEAAPVRSCQEGPTDFHFAPLLVVTVISGRPDYPVCHRVAGQQSAAGFKSLAKEFFEHVFPVTVPVRVLFPNERIRGNGIKIVEVLGPQRPELNTLSPQNGL